MGQDAISVLSAAAGTGEVLVVVYDGGRAPGHKRRIVVRSVDADAGQMFVDERGELRTYVISKTRVVDESEPLPWMPEDVGQVAVVSPDVYFSGWAFTIRRELQLALGVFPRYVIDKEKTTLARAQAVAGGMPKTEATRHVRILKREIVVNTPPVYRF